MIKYPFLIFTFCCCAVLGFSQTETDKTKYKYSLYGAGVKQQQTSYLSPLYYTGLSLMYSKGRAAILPKKIKTSVFDVNFDAFGNSRNESQILSFAIDYTLNRHYLLPFKDERYGTVFPKAFVGWGYWADLEVDVKPDNVNNVFYEHFNNMACLTFALEKKFKNVYIFNEFNLPLVGIYSGTEYSSIFSYVDVEEDEDEIDPLGMFDILFISQNTQLQNRLNVDFNIKMKKRAFALRFQYALGYRMLHLNNNTVHNVNHLFKIGYLFNKMPYVHQ